MAKTQDFQLSAGDPRLEVQLGFLAYGVDVDNTSSQWLYLQDVGRYVAPNSARSIPLPGTQKALVVWGSPPGKAQPLPVAGEVASLFFTSEPIRSTSGGISLVAGSSVSAVLERFAFAALPLPTNPGRLVELLDRDRSLWAESAVPDRWWPVTGGVGFNVMAFGAVGDGVADDTAAIQAAITAAGAGRTVLPPPPVAYRITATLNMLTIGAQLVGMGMTNGACVIRAGAAMTYMLRVSGGGFNALENFELDGATLATHGVIFHNAARTVARRVEAHNCTGNGFRFDLDAFAPHGNNNFVRLEYCRALACGGHGFAVPFNSTDNNAITFQDCEAQNCGTGAVGGGLLYKGVGGRILFGQYSANQDGGITLGEAADAGFTVDCLVLFPWLEGNLIGGVALTDGGVLTKKSVRNQIILQNGFTVVPSGTSSDVHTFATTGGSTGAPKLVVQGETPGGPLGGMSIGGDQAPFVQIEQFVTTGLAAWNPGLLAAGAQVALTVAMPAGTFARMTDTCLVSADVDLQDQQLTAYVRAANSVRVVLRNGTAAGINLGAFNVRVEVVKH